MRKYPKNIIAIIPARGGSRRIPDKNLAMLSGMPLLAHSITHARNSKYVSQVIVSTNDEEISDVAKDYQAKVIMRPDNISGDKDSSESALLHVLDNLGSPEPDLWFLCNVLRL